MYEQIFYQFHAYISLFNKQSAQHTYSLLYTALSKHVSPVPFAVFISAINLTSHQQHSNTYIITPSISLKRPLIFCVLRVRGKTQPVRFKD
jgi:hypothetical protein